MSEPTKQATRKKPAAKKPAAKKPTAKRPAPKGPAATTLRAGAAGPAKKRTIGAVGAAPKRGLPAALVERAEAEVAAKQARMATDARADIALILRRRERIAEDFYDIGEALARLKRPGIAEALGRASFSDVCAKDLSMSLATAEELVSIVAHVRREDAVRMGQTRALALVALANATPEVDTAATLEKATRRLPSGKHLDVTKASTREIQAAAKELRIAARPTTLVRGRTTTAEERAQAAVLQSTLHAAGLTRARVAAVATKPGQEADIRIERLPVSALGKLRAALAKTG